MKKTLAFGAVLVVAGAAAVGLAFAGDKTSTETAGDARKSCCAAGKNSMAGKQCPAEAASKGQPTKVGQEVTLAGKVLCEHCDLEKSKSCAPVLRADGRDGYMKICPTSNDLKGLKEAGAVEVKGFVRPGTDGQEEIEVISFNKKQAKVS